MSTSLDLYRQIAKFDFRQIYFPNEEIKFDDLNIGTLVVEHKGEFSTSKWQKICWFENYFSKWDSYISREYEDIISLKYSKFRSIVAAAECSKNLKYCTQNQIKETLKRLENANTSSSIELNCERAHLATVLDHSISSILQKYCGDNIHNVVTIDTVNSTKKQFCACCYRN